MSAHRTQRPIHLGKRVATYRSLPPARLTLGLWSGLILLASLQLASLIWGPESSVYVGLVITPAVAWVAWALHVPRRVDLHQNGVAYQVGRRHQYLFWNQIHEIYQTPLHAPSRLLGPRDRPDTWMYRLVKRDGRSIRLYHLESIRSLGQRIQEQMTRRHLPIAQDAFRAGYSIRFGSRLAISQAGLRLGRRIIGWHEIDEIVIDESSELRVTLDGSKPKTRGLAIRRIPNLLVLDGILRANQESLHQDPFDTDPQRGAIFEDSLLDSADEELTGNTLLLPGDEQDEATHTDDLAHAINRGFRPGQPK